MQSSTLVTSLLEKQPSAAEISELKAKKKFDVNVVSYASDTKEIESIMRMTEYRSDHLPVSHSAATTITWNMLKKCHTEFKSDGTEIKKTNNGFKKTEDLATYKKRLQQNFKHVGHLAKAHSAVLSHLPTNVLCLQEVSADVLTPEEINLILGTNNFTVSEDPTAPLDQKYLIQKCTPKFDEVLVMAYDYTKVTYMKSYDLKDIISEVQEKEARFQAIQFKDKLTQKEFVVVNLHQNWDKVNPINFDKVDSRDATYDVMHILEYFKKLGLPCIITGDFNTSRIRLNDEAGKLIIGQNANMCWNFTSNSYQADSCDHIIMNENYMKNFLPSLQQKLKEQREHKFDLPTEKTSELFVGLKQRA